MSRSPSEGCRRHPGGSQVVERSDTTGHEYEELAHPGWDASNGEFLISGKLLVALKGSRGPR